MRSLKWWPDRAEKKQTVRDAEADRQARERRGDSFDVCSTNSCHEVRSTQLRNLR
jgi:hypothetical protein